MANDNRAQKFFLKEKRCLIILTQGSTVIKFASNINSLAASAAKESYLCQVFWYNSYFHLWHNSILYKGSKLFASRVEDIAAEVSKPLNIILEHSFLFHSFLFIKAASKKIASSLGERVAHSYFYKLTSWLFNLDEQEK